MTKKKSARPAKAYHNKTKDPVRPLWMRVIKFIMMIVLAIVLIAAVAAILIKHFLHL